ncbi:MFS transporter [Terrihabitans soli]|uniref:MFS transporter n=1 Tax=Terrihabitans soli TaxID=708113 RepID=A0A6S6QGX2_9HYPH|nr:MFS transporter [Terrihabitans soli]BCJ89384.1 MFS transporter [Terrihabitans soli]
MQEAATTVPQKATAREWIGLAVLALPCLIYSMDLTVLNLAVPQLSEDLQPSITQTLWIMDIYGFFVAGSLITMGTLGDRIGRRKMLLIGAFCFGLFSLLAAFAPTAETLIVARALQGISAASLSPSTLSLIRNMFLDDRQRTFAIGVWIAAFSAGGAIGPLVGGAVLEHFWWGAVFIINVPIMLLLLAVGPILLPEYKDPDAGKLDILSAAQSVTGVLGIIFALKHIAAVGFDLLAAASLALGIVVAILFVRRQRRLAEPLIDVSLFEVPAVRSSLVVNMAGIFVLFGGFFFVAQYLQLAAGMGPLEAGLWLAPSGAIFAVGSLVTPAIVHRFRPSTIISIGFALTGLGFLVMTSIDYGGAWSVLAGLILFSTGFAPIATLTTDIVMTAVPPERAGQASGVSETSFEFGGATGIAVLGTIFIAVYRTLLDPLPQGLPAGAEERLRETLGGAFEIAPALPEPQSTELLALASQSFTHALAVTCSVSTVIAIGIAIFAATALRGPHDLSGREREAAQAA